MKSQVQRLNNIIGQIEGVKRMMEEKQDCIDILTQLKAVRSAVGSVMKNMVDEELDSCIQKVDSNNKELLVKIKNYVKNS